MKKILAILFLVVVFNSLGQEVRILDSLLKSPIENVNLIYESIGVSTNKNGFVNISSFNKGDTMPNDLTIADVQQLVRSELNNAVEEMKRNQAVIKTDGTQTTIDYRSVCDFMSGQIFDFCVTSDNQEVRNFGRDLCQQLAERFNIPNRWNI